MPQSPAPAYRLSRREMVKFLAAAPLAAPFAASALGPGPTPPAFTPTADMPDVSLQNIGLPEDARIIVAGNRDYWELYPTAETLAIESIDRLSDGVGLRFTLAATDFSLDHLEISAEGEADVTTEGRSFTLRFFKKHSLTPQKLRVDIHGISPTGDRSPHYYITLAYYSNAADAANGRTMFSRIGVRNTNLQLAYSYIDDWILDNPTAEDRAYAQERWGHLKESATSPYQQARAVMRGLLDEFEPRRGTPSDAMNGLHPFRQYERLLAGEDRCWCANMVEIMSLTFNSLDLPCRLVRMRHTYHNAAPDVPGQDFELMMVGGHTIGEIYDKTLGRWIFMDPSQRRLGVRDAAGHYLNFFEIHLQVNQPHRAEELRLDAYDPNTQTESVEAFPESAVRENFAHFARREQRFYYFRRG